MANIPQIKIGNTVYNIKDSEARSKNSELESAFTPIQKMFKTEDFSYADTGSAVSNATDIWMNSGESIKIQVKEQSLCVVFIDGYSTPQITVSTVGNYTFTAANDGYVKLYHRKFVGTIMFSTYRVTSEYGTSDYLIASQKLVNKVKSTFDAMFTTKDFSYEDTGSAVGNTTDIYINSGESVIIRVTERSFSNVFIEGYSAEYSIHVENVGDYTFTPTYSGYLRFYHRKLVCSVITPDYRVTSALGNSDYLIASQKLVNEVNNKIVKIQYTSIASFLRIGVIGDSYATGWLNVTGSSGTYPEISWLQQLARTYGVTGVNYSEGGMTARSWLTSSDGLTKLNTTDPCDLYYIALGINDVNTLGIDYLGTSDDYPLTYDQQLPTGKNATTFYFDMGKIILNILHHAPHAKIILSTMSWETNSTYIAFNEAILAIAEHYEVASIVQNDDPFFVSSFYLNNMVGNHPTVQLYGGMAKAIDRLTDKCMRENASYFNDIYPTCITT